MSENKKTSIDIEEEITKKLAEEIRLEIDKEILDSLRKRGPSKCYE